MKNKELLTYAAKAAGVKLDDGKWNGGADMGCFDISGNAVLDWHNGTLWNPIKSDGDAFRLMVDLDLNVVFYRKHVNVIDNSRSEEITTEYFHSNDAAIRREATRLAVVKAAANIGRAMS